MIESAKIAFWLAGAGLEIVVGGLMLRRKLYREHPFFFAYILNQVIRFAILFPIYQAHNRSAYAIAYPRLELLDAVMSFAVIYELFNVTFEQYEGIRELGWLLLRWSAALLAVVAVVIAVTGSGSGDPLEPFYKMERSVSFVRAGLLFFLFVLHGGLGLKWPRHAFGIALGFGMIACVELATFTLATRLGMTGAIVLSVMASASYTCAGGLWLFAFLRAAERPPESRPPRVNLDGWNRALLELLQR